MTTNFGNEKIFKIIFGNLWLRKKFMNLILNTERISNCYAFIEWTSHLEVWIDGIILKYHE